MTELGSADVRIRALLDDFERNVNEAKRQTQQFSSAADSEMRKADRAFSSFGRNAARSMVPMVAALAGVTLSITGLVNSIGGTINAADRLSKLSQQIGVTVEDLGRLQHMANLSGVSMEGMATGFRYLSQRMSAASRGTGDMAEKFADLGINVTDANGNLRDNMDVMADVADRFAQMEDGAEKTALAVELFGRSGVQMIPFLNQGRDGIMQMADEAERLGLVLDTKTAQAAERFNDNMTRVRGALQGVTNSFVISIMPALERFSEMMISVATAVADNMQRIITYATTAAAFFAGQWVWSFVAAGGATTALNAAIVLLRANIQRLLAATGIGALIVIIGELIFQFMQLIEKTGGVGQAFVKVGEIASEVWERIKLGGQALHRSLEGVALAIESAFLGAWSSILSGFSSMVSSIEGPLNAIRGALGQEEMSLGSSLGRASELAGQDSRRAGIASGIRFDWAGQLLSQATAPLEALREISDEQQTIIDQFGEMAGGIAENEAAMNDFASATGGGGAARAMEELKEASEQTNNSMQQLADTASSFFQGLFRDLRQGKSFTEALKNAVDRLIDSLLDQAIQSFFGSIFGGFGGGGLFGSLFGGFFANGGRPPMGRVSVVGERGPELFVPDQSGVIVPNHALGMSGQQQRVLVEVELKTDDTALAGIADTRIQNAAPGIVQVSVKQSTDTVRRNFASMSQEAQARQM